MGDVQSAGGSVEQPKLSQGAAASPPQVKKRPSVVHERPSLSRSVNPGALQPQIHISNTLMLGPLNESHVLEDGRILSFAQGSRYQGRRWFQLAAHRICFDHGFTLSVYHTPEITFPVGDCPRRGRLTLGCARSNAKCPFRIKLNFTLNEWGRSDEEVEYEVTGFVNSHNHGPFENSTIYRAPKITGKRFWPKVDGKSVGKEKEVSPEL